MTGHNGAPDMDGERPIDPDALENLIEEIPALIAIRAFAADAARTSWFKNVGASFSQELIDNAERFLDELGFPEITLAKIESWSDAVTAAESLDWNDPAWEAEEQLTAGLTEQALDVISEEALSVALSLVQARVGKGLFDHVADSAALWDENDEQIINAAAGAALRASHQAALVLCAEAAPAHPLAIKFQLFKSGHWPIGIAGSSFNLF